MSFISRRIKNIVNPPFFGMDISDLTIKFLRVSDGGGTKKTIKYFGEINIEPGIIVEGEVKNESSLSEILKKNLKDSEGKRVHEKFVVASLPEEKSFVRIIQLPKLKPSELATAVRWELEGNIPLPLDQVYFDYEVVGQEKPSDHTDVLITAFPRIIVDSYTEALKSAGLYPLALELESQAISRACITPDTKSVIILDVGMTRTSFIVFGGGSIILTLSIPFGGQTLNSAIADKLKVPNKEAEALKKTHGLDKQYKNGTLFEAMSPFLKTLVEEVQKQIWFYKEHSEHRHGSPSDIEKILLVGGDANLIGLEKYLAVALKRPVLMADPFVNVYGAGYKVIPSIEKNASLKYTTSIGLALRQ